MVSQWYNKDSEVNDEDTMKLVLKVFMMLSDDVIMFINWSPVVPPIFA